jgi:hypothetical protein
VSQKNNNKYFRTLFIMESVLVFSTAILAESNSTFMYDWNMDGIPDTFTCFSNSSSSPYDFDKIEVSLSGKGKFIFGGKDDTTHWMKYTSEFCVAPLNIIKKKSCVKSEFAALFKTEKNKLLLFLFGFSPNNWPGFLTTFALNTEGKPVIIYYDKADLVDVADVDNRGKIDIVLAYDREEIKYYKQNVYRTYRPFFVYTIDSVLTLNNHLSEVYNKKNNIGWVGFDTLKEYVVCRDVTIKKDVLIKMSDAKVRCFH